MSKEFVFCNILNKYWFPWNLTWIWNILNYHHFVVLNIELKYRLTLEVIKLLINLPSFIKTSLNISNVLYFVNFNVFIQNGRLQLIRNKTNHQMIFSNYFHMKNQVSRPMNWLALSIFVKLNCRDWNGVSNGSGVYQYSPGPPGGLVGSAPCAQLHRFTPWMVMSPGSLTQCVYPSDQQCPNWEYRLFS